MTTYANVRLWDGVSEDYSAADSIEVADGAIVRLGRGLRGRDCDGLAVVPGLIDAHVHMVLDPMLGSVAEQLAETPDAVRRKMAGRAVASMWSSIPLAARTLEPRVGCWRGRAACW